jgi:hypothetical protein
MVLLVEKAKLSDNISSSQRLIQDLKNQGAFDEYPQLKTINDNFIEIQLFLNRDLMSRNAMPKPKKDVSLKTLQLQQAEALGGVLSDPCWNCGSMAFQRSGTCLTCMGCQETTGCS